MKDYEVISDVRRTVHVCADSECEALNLAEKIFSKDRFHKKTKQHYFEPWVCEFGELYPKPYPKVMKVWKREKDKDIEDMSVLRLVLGENSLGYIVVLGELQDTETTEISYCEYAEEL